MAGTPLNHFGVLVRGLEETVERYQELFGLTFHPLSTMRFNRMCDPGERSIEIHAALSIEGPPYVELIEAIGDGIFGTGQGLGFHHVGLLDSCIEARKEVVLGEMYVQAEAYALTPEGITYLWFSEPSTTHGVRFEFINEEVRATLMAKLMENASKTSPRRDSVFEI